jgi:hypothetical protein
MIMIAFLTFLFSIGINSLELYADPTFRIAATGDIGCSTSAQSTVNQIKNQNPNLVLWLGDLSYVDANIDCFISQTSQLASKDEAIVGNHDDSEDGSSAARTQLINHFGLPSNGYYSKTFDVVGTQRTDDILLIGMDSQSSIASSSSQYAFVSNSLQNSNSPLKIVIVHKPFLTCTCQHSANGQFNAYQSLFKQYGVNLVIQGHNHNIQYFNPIDNVKYIVSGAGGRSHYSLTSTPQPAHFRDSSSYGFTLIDANFATNELQGKFITSSGTDQTSSHFVQLFSSIPQAPPVANNQAVTTNKNTAKPITLSATDPNNDPLTYTIVTGPSHGTVSGTGASRTYTPAPDYVGPDSFTFKANDGIVDSNTATVSITVQDTGSGSCGTNLPISGVTASSDNGNVPSNVLDNNLNTRWSNNPGLPAYITADLGTSKPICEVDIAWYLGNARFYTFTISTSTTGSTGPFTNVFSGTSSGTTVNSEKYTFAETSARYVRITVTASPQTSNQYGSMTELDIFGSSASNSPPVANNQAVTTNKNTAKAITLTATDANNDPLTYTIVTPPAHGTITAGTGAARTYTPTTNYVGPDSFTFKANDGNVDSNTATVSITVQDNSAPVANNQAVTTNKNTAKSITLTATDANNDPLTYTIVTGPAHGTISAGTGASRTYTPTTNYVGPDSFTFKANDGNVDSNTATVSITVQDTTTTCTTNLSINGVTANPDNGFGNVPENVLDNNLNTRWSHLGLPSFITADLGSIKNICSEDIAWYLGNERVYTFSLATSTDGTTFTNKLTNVKSSGTTLNSEKYTFPATDARYVRVTVTGNTANNNYASITEIDIYGTSASAASSSYNYGPSLTLSGPGG